MILNAENLLSLLDSKLYWKMLYSLKAFENYITNENLVILHHFCNVIITWIQNSHHNIHHNNLMSAL